MQMGRDQSLFPGVHWEHRGLFREAAGKWVRARVSGWFQPVRFRVGLSCPAGLEGKPGRLVGSLGYSLRVPQVWTPIPAEHVMNVCGGHTCPHQAPR